MVRRGKFYFDPLKQSVKEIHRILDTAKKLKLQGANNLHGYLSGKRVALSTTNKVRSVTAQTFMWTSATLLGAKICPIYTQWEKLCHKEEYGKMLSKFSDIILIEGDFCHDTHAMSVGCDIPVIHCTCSRHQPLQAFANLLTIEEHFGSLDNIIFGWVGPGGPILNSFMLILPKFNITVQYSCSDDPSLPVSPMLLELAKTVCDKAKTRLIECLTPEKAIKGAHVIATTRHNHELQKITLQLLKQAHKDWIFLHDLPRGKCEVDTEVFEHSRSLVYKNFENMVYVCMAVMLYTLEKKAEDALVNY
ncbi:ornithine transcarbamylase, mitochondrial-like [Lycorma delicatula]|uniref:ornithine transcarbamylase, mitochondrial-like n=1 Tax=Lycorma delicatula TaxID=130591 RepID=UPI003F51768E